MTPAIHVVGTMCIPRDTRIAATDDFMLQSPAINS